MTPRVSVIVPSYNHARFLRACLESVRAQSFSDWEIVLIDDGSQDESVELAREIAAKEPRLRVFVNEKNLGTYGTQARGLELAAAPVVAILNSDDLWAHDKLERQIAALDANPDCALCYVLGSMVDARGEPIAGEDVHADWPREERQEVLPFLLYENRILASGVLYRREGLRFEASCRYSGDWVVLLERARAAPFACVPERLTFWRQHEHNTYVRSVGQISEEIRVREAILREADRWFLPRLDRRAVAAGLARNAMNLFALRIYFSDRAGARRAGRVALRFHPDKKSALKRTLATVLPAAYLRDYFWKGADRDWLGVDVEEARRRLCETPPLRFAP